MKKVIFIIFFIIHILFNMQTCFAEVELHEKEINLNGDFSEYLKEVNIEGEVKKYFQFDPIYINLRECIQIALIHSLYQKSANYDYISYQWKYKESLSNFLPEFTSSSYIIHYNGQVLVGAALLDDFDEVAISTLLRGTHYLTNGGEQIFNALSKKSLKFAKMHQLNYTRAQIIYYVTKYYYELLKCKLDIEIYRKNYDERYVQLVLTQNRLKSGLGTKFDVIRSQTELSQAKQNLLDTLENFKFAQAKLCNIMGIEITTALMPIETEAKEYKYIDDENTVENLYACAQKNREDIKKIQSEINSLKNEKRMIYTEFVPRARVFVQKQWQGTASAGLAPATLVAGYIDINLGKNLGVGTITQAKGKQAEIDKKIVDLEQTLRDTKEKIVQAFYESKISKDRITISKNQEVYAKESVELAEMRLNAGEGILIDVIQAQTFKTRVRIELLNSIIRYNIAQAQMLFESGQITVEKILKDYSP